MRMPIAMLILLSLQGAVSAAPIAVIVNAKSTLGELTRKQVLEIYTGRLLSLPNDHIPLPLDLQGHSPLKEDFYRGLMGKNLAQINSYWARLLFSGQATPPRALPNSAAVLNAVRANPDAIGYVSLTEAGASVKVLFTLNP